MRRVPPGGLLSRPLRDRGLLSPGEAPHWFHHHDIEVHPFTYLNLVGDGVHNFIDGAIIATSLAVIVHEIPKEVGDFGILVYGGFSRSKALFYNFLSALGAFLGGIGLIHFTTRALG